VTRYAPLWQQDSSFPAADDRQLIATMWPFGGVRTAPGARATVVNNSWNVSVPANSVVVPLVGTNGAAVCTWDAPEIVTMNPAPVSGQFRWDWIIVQVRDPVLDGGNNSDFILTTVSSATAAPYPPRPSLPPNSYAMYELGMNGGNTNLNSINPGDIRAPLGPSYGVHGRWSRNGAFTVGSGAGNWIQFDTAIEDPFGMLLTFGYPGDINLPYPGRWLITGQVSANPTAGLALAVQLQYRRGATLYGIMSTQSHASSAWGISGNIGPISISNVQVGDLIHVNASTSAGSGSWTGQTGMVATEIALDWLGY
jgi:hypothetical protein